ncbi:MAG: hypothetical protein E6K81_13305, partial [Candidatus Eisenbacteria bacterium]
PIIEATDPPIRGTSVFYGSEVWVQFGVALDTTTATTHTVFLKQDTQRIPIALTWEPATRRLHLRPQVELSLGRTYTVELLGTLAFKDGSVLGQTYAWQFTTIAVRRPQSPLPMDGQGEQSPFVALRWGGLTEASAGPVVYDLHLAADSATAVDPAQPAAARLSGPPFVPRTRWHQDANYWAIHAINTGTGERLVGPAWRFATLAAGAPYDSVAASVMDWDWVDFPAPTRQHCNEDSIAMSPTITCTIRWNLGPIDTTVKLLGAGIDLSPRYATVPAVPVASVWYARYAWNRCEQGWAGPPITDEVNGKLADGVVVAPTRLRFSSDALTAHVEATRRLGGLFGYLFRADPRRSYYGGGSGGPTVRATLWLRVYRATAPAGARAIAGRRTR